jgi:hypothetical protein
MPARLGLRESMGNASLIPEVVDITVDFDKSQTISIAFVCSHLGMGAGFLELLSALSFLELQLPLLLSQFHLLLPLLLHHFPSVSKKFFDLLKGLFGSLSKSNIGLEFSDFFNYF